MAGKVIAALGLSLTSSILYVGSGIVVLQSMALIGLVPLHLLPWFFAYLIANVLMLAALGVALGSACSTPQDAQSLAGFLVFPVVIPAMMMVAIINQPNGTAATVMSLIPPFTPMLMLLRQALPVGIPAWQPWAGLAGVVLCTLVIIWGGSRIFRVGILMQGKPPRIGEILRWALKG
jgi:ABC-2 type transport system permease protein